MAQLVFGSARIDEHGSANGGASGDQKQTSTPDYSGEVSMQKFYVHKKGWIVLRPKSISVANKIADAMVTACNNPNIGYNQSDRLGIISNGTNTTKKCNCDCSSLVRECVKEGSGVDVGNFTTANEKDFLYKSGVFYEPMVYADGLSLCNGDVLVTKTKGHTGIICSGRMREKSASEYYPAYLGTSDSLVDALKSVGEADVSFTHRKAIAKANSIDGNYTGSYVQNLSLMALLKKGLLIKTK